MILTQESEGWCTSYKNTLENFRPWVGSGLGMCRRTDTLLRSFMEQLLIDPSYVGNKLPPGVNHKFL